MDEVALGGARAFETEFYRALRGGAEISPASATKQFDDQLKGALDNAVKEFAKDFLARKAAAA